MCWPGNDFWVFDDRLVRFHHFAGDNELSDDPAVVRLCASAFEAVWGRVLSAMRLQYRPGLTVRRS